MDGVPTSKQSASRERVGTATTTTTTDSDHYRRLTADDHGPEPVDNNYHGERAER